MKMVTGSQLVFRSDAELGSLFHSFNQAIARIEPFTRDWADAVLSVENILRERNRRVDAPRPS